jgi:hypothetical protein
MTFLNQPENLLTSMIKLIPEELRKPWLLVNLEESQRRRHLLPGQFFPDFHPVRLHQGSFA